MSVRGEGREGVREGEGGEGKEGEGGGRRGGGEGEGEGSEWIGMQMVLHKRSVRHRGT